jgi:hypothetical protein
MDFYNNVQKSILFSLDPTGYSLSERTKFTFKLTIGPSNSYYTSLKIVYFVCQTNDPVILALYLYNSNREEVGSDAVKQTTTYNQALMPPPGSTPSCTNILTCVLNGVTNLLGALLVG